VSGCPKALRDAIIKSRREQMALAVRLAKMRHAAMKMSAREAADTAIELRKEFWPEL
jgi:hypothetical protein